MHWFRVPALVKLKMALQCTKLWTWSISVTIEPYKSVGKIRHRNMCLITLDFLGFSSSPWSSWSLPWASAAASCSGPWRSGWPGLHLWSLWSWLMGGDFWYYSNILGYLAVSTSKASYLICQSSWSLLFFRTELIVRKLFGEKSGSQNFHQHFKPLGRTMIRFW